MAFVPLQVPRIGSPAAGAERAAGPEDEGASAEGEDGPKGETGSLPEIPEEGEDGLKGETGSLPEIPEEGEDGPKGETGSLPEIPEEGEEKTDPKERQDLYRRFPRKEITAALLPVPLHAGTPAMPESLRKQEAVPPHRSLQQSE